MGDKPFHSCMCISCLACCFFTDRQTKSPQPDNSLANSYHFIAMPVFDAEMLTLNCKACIPCGSAGPTNVLAEYQNQTCWVLLPPSCEQWQFWVSINIRRVWSHHPVSNATSTSALGNPLTPQTQKFPLFVRTFCSFKPCPSSRFFAVHMWGASPSHTGPRYDFRNDC